MELSWNLKLSTNCRASHSNNELWLQKKQNLSFRWFIRLFSTMKKPENRTVQHFTTAHTKRRENTGTKHKTKKLNNNVKYSRWYQNKIKRTENFKTRLTPTERYKATRNDLLNSKWSEFKVCFHAFLLNYGFREPLQYKERKSYVNNNENFDLNPYSTVYHLPKTWRRKHVLLG